METFKLSDRLTRVAHHVSAGCYFADIGSDHAYLPIYICRNNQASRAIAGELNEGPYQAAVTHVSGHQLEERIKVKKGNGLTVIEEEPITEVVICGMGGGLIRSILSDNESKLRGVSRLILQPNVDAHYLRKWLEEASFEITAEEIIKEDGHIYEIIVAERSAHKVKLTDKERYFGPYLMKEKSEVFIEKWKREKDNVDRVINQMSQAKKVDDDKKQQFIKESEWIEEVIANG